MKKKLLLLFLATSFLNVFSQEQTTTKEAVTTAVKAKVEEVITSKKDTLMSKAKEVIATKIENVTEAKAVTSNTSTSNATTYYLITNGETKAPSDKYPDPYLNKTGEKKAEKWVEILADIKFDAFYAQELTSAKQTAQVISTSQNLGIFALDTKNIYSDSFKYNTDGKTVLIVADNAALAVFANAALGQEKYTMKKVANYSDFYIVTVNNGSSNAIKLNIE